MSEFVKQMAKAHLLNVTQKRDELVAQRDALTREIEKIEEFLRKGLEELSILDRVEDDKPMLKVPLLMSDEQLEEWFRESGTDHSTREEIRKSRLEAAERNLDRMPPTSLKFKDGE